MKTTQPLGTLSVLAAASLGKNLFVGFDGNIASANAKAAGVSDAKTDSGEMCPVVYSGIALIISGGTIPQGRAIVVGSGGKAALAGDLSLTIPGGGTAVYSYTAQPSITPIGCVPVQQIMGWAIDASSGADQLIRIMLT